MSTILVLGGGSGQLSLLKHLRADGVRIVLQDRNPDCAGRPLADEFIPSDTCDPAAAADSARRFSVDGVCTAGTDQPVLAAARAAAARGCPSLIDADTALAVTDKEVMKGLLAAAGIAVPLWRIAGPGDDDGILNGLRPPYVAKPVDSQGQRGVVRFDSASEFVGIRDASLEWSRRKRLIVEEYHRHHEVTVSGWIHRGRADIWAVTDRVTKDFGAHIGLCLAHRYPSAYASGCAEEVDDLTRRCAAALGMTEGPLYFQFLITQDGGILVNECAARLGGAYEEISLPPVCGVDPISLLIAGTLEGRADPAEGRFRVPVTAESFAVPLMFCRPGRITRQAGERRVKALPGVTDFAFLLTDGTVVRPPRNSVQRAAYLVAHAERPSEVNRILKRAMSRLTISDSRGRQMLGKTLGYGLNPL